MKLANATNTNRKFGKPRDLLCALPERNCASEAPTHQARLIWTALLLRSSIGSIAGSDRQVTSQPKSNL